MTSKALLALCSIALAASVASADASFECTGATNSTGSSATLRWNGPFDPIGGTLSVSNLPPGSRGMMLYGWNATHVPFGNGFSCVGGTNWTMARKSADAQGYVQFDIDADSDPDDLLWLQWPGNDEFYFQHLYRDLAAGGAGFNLSSTIRVNWE